MPTYISIANLTDQGIRNMKDLSRRLQNAEQQFAQMGAELKEVYLLMGQFDYIVIAEVTEDLIWDLPRIRNLICPKRLQPKRRASRLDDLLQHLNCLFVDLSWRGPQLGILVAYRTDHEALESFHRYCSKANLLAELPEAAKAPNVFGISCGAKRRQLHAVVRLARSRLPSSGSGSS